jgi:hypothetical protein
MDELARVAALVSGAAILVSANAASRHQSKMAAIVNGSLAGTLILIDAPQLVQFALDRAGYIAQYGGAAVPQLALNGWGVALGIFSLACSWIAFPNRPVAFWLGWIGNIPQVVLIWYLAFWFHIES